MKLQKKIKTSKNMMMSINIITLAYFSFTFINVYYLINAKKVVNALISFFCILINFIFCFFYIKSDYVGVIVMIVYFGAIIIFFAFALMTIDPRHFEYNEHNKKNYENDNFFTKISKITSFFFISIAYFYIHYNPIKNINFSKNFNEYFINNKFKTDSIFIIYETTAAQALGKVIYTAYVYPLNTLGIILFISLVCSLAVLKPTDKKNDI